MTKEFWHDAAVAAFVVVGGYALFVILCRVALRIMGVM